MQVLGKKWAYTKIASSRMDKWKHQQRTILVVHNSKRLLEVFENSQGSLTCLMNKIQILNTFFCYVMLFNLFNLICINYYWFFLKVLFSLTN